MSKLHAAALAHALKLAVGGIPCFPCLPNKRPACTHGFKDATSSPDELRALWQHSPGTLVGVPTGEPSGLFAVDVDSDRHPEANDWLERHSPYLPDTRQHQTKSGGWHLLFQHRVGLRNSQGKLAKGVDTRGDGGYIVWWPSHLGEFAAHRLIPTAPVPDWIVEALTPPSRPMRGPSTARSIAVDLRRAAPAPDRIQGIIATVASAREGERNAITFWGACRIHEMLAERELDQGTGADALEALIEAASRSGLPLFEVKRTIKSAMQT